MRKFKKKYGFLLIEACLFRPLLRKSGEGEIVNWIFFMGSVGEGKQAWSV